MTESKIRGSLLYTKKQIITELYGSEAYDGIVLDIKDDEVKKILSRTIISGEWYPQKVLLDFISEIEKKYGREFFRKMLQIQLERQIKGVYGIIVGFMSPERILPRAEKMWRKQYSTGNFLINYEEYRITGVLSDYETTDIHAFGIFVWIEKLIEIVLKKEIKKSSYSFVDKSTLHFVFEL